MPEIKKANNLANSYAARHFTRGFATRENTAFVVHSVK